VISCLNFTTSLYDLVVKFKQSSLIISHIMNPKRSRARSDSFFELDSMVMASVVCHVIILNTSTVISISVIKHVFKNLAVAYEPA
jgi:hypothetical protein